MNKLKLSLAWIALSLTLWTSPALAAEVCDNLFTTVKPFSVSDPNFMGRILGRILYSSGYAPSYKQVLPYAQSKTDFLDLFASFRENGVSAKAQKALLKVHPSLVALKASDKMIEDYVQSYNKALDQRIIESSDSPLFKELTSPKIVNQCSTGTCWINSSTSVLESVLSKDGRLDISEQYIYMQSLIERAERSSRMGISILEGGNMNEFLQLIQQKGYVQSKNWKPAMDLYKNKERVVTALQALARVYRPYFLSALKAANPQESLKATQESFYIQAELVMTKLLGPLPRRELIQKLPDNLEVENFVRTSGLDSIQPVLQKLTDAIDSGKEAYIGLNSSAQDFRQKKLVDISSGNASFGHAMAVVGYIKDSRGQVQLLKIKNSWGPKAGDQGYIYLGRNFLQRTYRTAAILSLRPTP